MRRGWHGAAVAMAVTFGGWNTTWAQAPAQGLPETGSEIRLWSGRAPHAVGDDAEDTPALVVYRPDAGSVSGAAFVVLPGGGYARRAAHEGEPVARWLASHGITAFVARYRVSPYRHPAPLADASRAIRYVRAHAAGWGIDPQRIGILGFSAGGHLASTAATLFGPGDPAASDPIDRVSSRPDVAILIYPVITFTDDVVHAGSRANLLGAGATADEWRALSSEHNVRPDVPPIFLVHSTGDTAVPPENSLLLVEALRRHEVPVELHLYEGGRHGFGLGEGDGPLATWPMLAANWLARRGFTARSEPMGDAAASRVEAIDSPIP